MTMNELRLSISRLLERGFFSIPLYILVHVHSLVYVNRRSRVAQCGLMIFMSQTLLRSSPVRLKRTAP